MGRIKYEVNFDGVLLFQVDDFDLFKKRMLGSAENKHQPHKRALLFVDNSGADIVLGMLPLARELLRRGTEVCHIKETKKIKSDFSSLFGNVTFHT